MNYYKVLGLVGIFTTTIFSLFYFVRYFNNTRVDYARRVYEVLSEYQVPYDIDRRGMGIPTDTTPQPTHGIEECIKNLAYFTEKDLPIKMLLVGFPFKSSNQEKKVLGYLPDMAERKSLEYLQKILDEIKQVYAPGAKILIFTDGISFAEFFGIPFDHVIAYEHGLKQLVQDLPDISIFSSDDMLRRQQLSSVHDIIKLIDQYGPSDEQFRDEHNSIPETPLKRFTLELDHPQGKRLIEEYGFDNIVMKLLAREMRLRNYIAQEFPAHEFFRLTVHFCPDVTKKFGIRLSPTSDITPYHGVLLQENSGAWTIHFRKDVDLQKYRLDTHLVNGLTCPYFKAF
jgi:pyoverdine/dityrosine biosynthesis protein Dit1